MSIIKIDIDSDEFQSELQKTIAFTNGVLLEYGLQYNPEPEVNEGVQLGLSRNKMMYGERFCPCFMVDTTGDKPKSVDDRVCPCKPALEREIPQNGTCHCGIFCTPEFISNRLLEMKMKEVVHTHSRGLTKDECEILVNEAELTGEELLSLLEAREIGMIKFKLVDVREHMEWKMGHISGADALVPTSSFFQVLDDAKLSKSENIILYCHVGSRSAHCARILGDMGYEKIGNLTHGIVSYGGDIER